MIFFQSFLLVSLRHVVDQDINHQQTDCPGPIYGTVGQNVTLKCKLEEKLDKVNVFLKWTLKNESSGLLKQVHVFRSEGDDEDSQHPDYKNRTSVFPEQFEHGNISLELTNVTKKDEGTYTWTVHINNNFPKSGNITLHVADKSGPQGNWTGGDENRLLKNETGGETNHRVLIILGGLVFIAIIAFVVYKQRDKICDGEGGHAEGNDAPVNPEQEPLNADNQQDLNG